jgi:hypothetical protein
MNASAGQFVEEVVRGRRRQFGDLEQDVMGLLRGGITYFVVR